MATDLNKNINLKSSPNTTIDENIVKNEKIGGENINENTIKKFRSSQIKISNLENPKRTSKNLNNLLDKLPQNEQSIGDLDFNNKIEKNCNSYQEKPYKEEYKEYNINSKKDFNNININTKSNDNFFAETNRTTKNIYNLATANDIIKTDEENVKIEYNYNLSDFIKSIFSKCNCFKSKDSKIKNALMKKANALLYNKLDIAVYVRNMISFDVMKDLILEPKTKDIVNFLVRPIISLSPNEDNELPLFHKNYAESDFDKFYQEIIELSNKDKITDEENRLISLTNKHLKELYI